MCARVWCTCSRCQFAWLLQLLRNSTAWRACVARPHVAHHYSRHFLSRALASVTPPPWCGRCHWLAACRRSWLTTASAGFAKHQRRRHDIIEARGIVHKDGAEHLIELTGNSISSPTRRRGQDTGHGARQWWAHHAHIMTTYSCVKRIGCCLA